MAYNYDHINPAEPSWGKFAVVANGKDGEWHYYQHHAAVYWKYPPGHVMAGGPSLGTPPVVPVLGAAGTGAGTGSGAGAAGGGAGGGATGAQDPSVDPSLIVGDGSSPPPIVLSGGGSTDDGSGDNTDGLSGGSIGATTTTTTTTATATTQTNPPLGTPVGGGGGSSGGSGTDAGSGTGTGATPGIIALDPGSSDQPPAAIPLDGSGVVDLGSISNTSGSDSGLLAAVGTDSSGGQIDGSGGGGSTDGGSSTGSDGTVSPVGGAGSSYMVQQGDSLWSIAQANNMSLPQLEALNPQIADPSLLLPGQQINLTGSDSSSGGATSAGNTYTVAHGDTMSGIAQANNIPLSQLEALNTQISNPNLIFPGQLINLSGGAAPVAVAPSDTSGGGAVSDATPTSYAFPTSSSYQATTLPDPTTSSAVPLAPAGGGDASGTSAAPDPLKSVVAAVEKEYIDPFKIKVK